MVIGAGSVVFKNIPSDCVVVGNPARIVKKEGVKMCIRDRLRLVESLRNYVNNPKNANEVIPANVGLQDQNLGCLLYTSRCV